MIAAEGAVTQSSPEMEEELLVVLVILNEAIVLFQGGHEALAAAAGAAEQDLHIDRHLLAVCLLFADLKLHLQNTSNMSHTEP